jgi:ABC-2 type transport system permease protein
LISNTSRLWFRPVATAPTDPEAVLVLLQKIGNLPIPPFLAGQGLAAAGLGDWLGALLGVASFLVLSLGGFALCVWVADGLYATGWMRMQSSGVANRNKGKAAREARNSGLLGKASPPVAFLLKDWRVIPRDLRNFAQFLTPLFLLPVIYLNFFSGSRNGINAVQQVNNLTRGAVDFGNVFIAASLLFTVELVFNRIASAGLSMEGKAYWLIKTAPIEPWEFVLGKFLTAMVPFGTLSTVLFVVVAVWRRFTVWGTLYGLFGILLIGAAELAVETGMGIPWANLEWDDPRKMRSGLGTFISFFICMGMGLLAGAGLCLPLLLRIVLPDYEIFGWFAGPLLAILVTVTVSGVVLGIGLKRLPMMGET